MIHKHLHAIHQSASVPSAAVKALEALEGRRLLSGVVQVALHDGSLHITGDNADNAISITAGEAAGSIIVTGLQETTIEGSSEVTGVSKDVHIRMKRGNDIVILGAEDEHEGEAVSAEEHEEDEKTLFILPRDLKIDMDDGNDGVRIQSVDVGRDLEVKTGKGDDTVDIGRGPTIGQYEEHEHEEIFVAALAAAAEEEGGGEEEGGCGGDEGGGPPPDIVVAASIRITTDDGSDGVKVAFGRVGKDLTIDTGKGADLVVTGRGPVRGVHGEGEDEEGCGGGESGGGENGGGSGENGSGQHGQGKRPPDLRIADDVDIDTGDDADFASLRNTRVEDRFTCDTGKGNDDLAMQNLRAFGPAAVETGDDDDRLAIFDGSFDKPLTINTGKGDDMLAALGATFNGRTWIGTDRDDDSVILSACTAAAELSVRAGRGDDVVALSGANVFAGAVAIDGERDHDTLVDDAATGFTGLYVKNFEPDGPGLDVDATLDGLVALFKPFLQGR